MYCSFFLFFISLVAIIYHHIGYAVLLKYFSSGKPGIQPPEGTKDYHFVFIIPMYNEAVFIEQKIANLAELDYPFDKYEVVLIDDGSQDKTKQLARSAAERHPQLSIKIQSFSQNQGKVAVLNSVIPTVPNESILFFSDVSARLSTNVLKRANAYFNNPKIGAYCTKFKLHEYSLKGEQRYWDYQEAIKMKESLFGSPIGYHGSGYAIRKALWEPLPANIINDDFIMPMRIIEKGYLGVYDEESSSTELELSSDHLDWNRRVRIAQGNIQQVAMLHKLLSPVHGYVSWMFFSSKVMRVTMPWFFLILLISSFVLSRHNPLIFLPILIAQTGIILLVIINQFLKMEQLNVLSYFVKGQCSIFMGWMNLFRKHNQWKKANTMSSIHYIHPIVRLGKWVVDKISAIIGLSIMIVLLPVVAIIIKITSPGPVFYKQLRVGKGNEKLTKLIHVYKFRTMNVDADQCDIRWTLPGDSRIFPFGTFLRRTHIDELPQFYNILKGDMSLIGPRPEKPSLYSYIEKNIPFYEERLFGLLPGLTGLAQVTYPPDSTIEDVKKKVACDHAYAIQLTKPWLWIKVDTIIVLKTIQNVLLGKGQ